MLGFCFFFSKIIKKSCIEILAAEPSSVCAGGKRCEERGLALLVRRVCGRGVRLCHQKPLVWNTGSSHHTDAHELRHNVGAAESRAGRGVWSEELAINFQAWLLLLAWLATTYILT